MRTLTTTCTALAALLLLAVPAQAQPGPGGGMGPGGGRGMGMGGGPGRCGMALMHAPPDVLKAKFGLNDGQVSKLQPVRTNFLSKRINLQAQVQQQQLQLGQLYQAVLPDENKVLALHRKIRNLKGQLAEERIKAQLKLMAVLTPEQRTKLRTECPAGGPGKGKGMGMGMGHGRHGRHGGGGGGGWGGGGW